MKMEKEMDSDLRLSQSSKNSIPPRALAQAPTYQVPYNPYSSGEAKEEMMLKLVLEG